MVNTNGSSSLGFEPNPWGLLLWTHPSYPCFNPHLPTHTNTHTQAGTILWQAYEASSTFSIPVKVPRRSSVPSVNPAVMWRWYVLKDYGKWHAQPVRRATWACNSVSRGLWAMRTRKMTLERWLFQQWRAEGTLESVPKEENEWRQFKGDKRNKKEREETHTHTHVNRLQGKQWSVKLVELLHIFQIPK